MIWIYDIIIAIESLYFNSQQSHRRIFLPEFFTLTFFIFIVEFPVRTDNSPIRIDRIIITTEQSQFSL